MYDYETSEQLFLDIWCKYGCPEEVEDSKLILSILEDLINESKHQIVLDHYSYINFDEIIKVEHDSQNNLFKLFWVDNNKYRLASKTNSLSEMDYISWAMMGFCTYEYIAIDINKIKFLKIENHIFILLQANMVAERELKKKIIGENEIIGIENCTERLYSRYTFWEGDKENLIKVECIANNLPYYVCVIQPKEGIPNTGVSKKLLLIFTLKEINKRLESVWFSLQSSFLEKDELFAKGNIIRIIMEYALKHVCVIFDIPINIEQKYGHIKLGELKKHVKTKIGIEISQSLIDMANELSHDSGVKYSIDDIKDFFLKVKELVKEIQTHICDKEQVDLG